MDTRSPPAGLVFLLRLSALLLVVNVLMVLSFIVKEVMFVMMAVTSVLGAVVACKGAGRLEVSHEELIGQLHLDEETGIQGMKRSRMQQAVISRRTTVEEKEEEGETGRDDEDAYYFESFRYNSSLVFLMRAVAAMMFVDSCWMLVLAIKTFISDFALAESVVYPTLLIVIGVCGTFSTLVFLAGANAIQTYRSLLQRAHEGTASKRHHHQATMATAEPNTVVAAAAATTTTTTTSGMTKSESAAAVTENAALIATENNHDDMKASGTAEMKEASSRDEDQGKEDMIMEKPSRSTSSSSSSSTVLRVTFLPPLPSQKKIILLNTPHHLAVSIAKSARASAMRKCSSSACLVEVDQVDCKMAAMIRSTSSPSIAGVLNGAGAVVGRAH